MSHFYAMIPQSARKTTATARGHVSTGIATIAASYAGAIRTELRHREGRDEYRIVETDWGNGNTMTRRIVADWTPFAPEGE